MTVEILVSPHMKMTDVHCSWDDDVRVVQMPAEEMCLEDLPQMVADLRELDR
jgi:hypothetical protein